MSASKYPESIKTDSNYITKCPICLEPFKTPKLLPCLHTFCLECIEKHGEDEEPGDKLACPFCRQEFTIPPEGFKALPGNCFIEQLLEERNNSRSNDVRSVQCEICLGTAKSTGDTSGVTMHCVECGKNICDTCSEGHRNIRLTRDHKIVLIDDKKQNRTLMKSRP